MPQIARPISISSTDWTGAYTALGDDQDATYVESPREPTASDPLTATLAAMTDPGVDTGHTLTVRVAIDSGEHDPLEAVIELLDGATDTVIKTATYRLTSTPTDVVLGLSAAEAALVNYSNTKVRVKGQPESTMYFTASDFTYLGGFILPDSGSLGLTHRYRAGQIELFTAGSPANAGGGPVYAYAVPTLRTTPPYNTASLNASWGGDGAGIYGSCRIVHDAVVGQTYGLFWDEPSSRLYWLFADDYNGGTGDTSRMIGYSTLNDMTQTATAYGPWGFPAPPGYKTVKGFTPIPSAYRSYFNNWRLAAGFGGYESTANGGPASMGSALIPFDHTAFDRITPHLVTGYLTASDVSIIMNHPFAYSGSGFAGTGTVLAYDRPYRGTRDTDYMHQLDGWLPRDGVGYWCWGDTTKQSAYWIDTGRRTGFIQFVTQQGGNERGWIDPAFTCTRNAAYDIDFWGRIGRGWNVKTIDPIANLRIGDVICWPTTNVEDDIAAIDHIAWALVNVINGSELIVTLAASGRVPNPVPSNGYSTVDYGEGGLWRLGGPEFAYRGTVYYGGQGNVTEGKLQCYSFRSSDLVSGTPVDQVMQSADWTWDLPSGADDVQYATPFPSYYNAPACASCTFDVTTNHLYVLMQYAAPNASPVRDMVFVYQVTP